MMGNRMHCATAAALVTLLALSGCGKDEETAVAPPAPAPEPAAMPTAAPEPTPEPTPVAPQDSEATTYTVKPGDTLPGIAREVYGSADNWNAILEANGDQVTDPDKIFVGQVLKIPAQAESASN